MNKRAKVFLLSFLIISVLTFLMFTSSALLTSNTTTAAGGGRGRRTSTDGAVSGGGGSLDTNIIWGEITGIFALIALIFVFAIGIPQVQIYFKKYYTVSRKDIIQIHCDLGLLTVIAVVLHLYFLATTKKWSAYFAFYEWYPKTFLPMDTWGSVNTALTFGFWAGFIMALATLAGYYRRQIYHYFGRNTFLLIQDLTILSLIGVVIHAIDIGRILSVNIPLQWTVIILSAVIILTLIWFRIPKEEKPVK